MWAYGYIHKISDQTKLNNDDLAQNLAGYSLRKSIYSKHSVHKIKQILINS